jgi:hypothetical protein
MVERTARVGSAEGHVVLIGDHPNLCHPNLCAAKGAVMVRSPRARNQAASLAVPAAPSSSSSYLDPALTRARAGPYPNEVRGRYGNRTQLLFRSLVSLLSVQEAANYLTECGYLIKKHCLQHIGEIEQ